MGCRRYASGRTPLVGDLANLGEAENLKASGIGEDRAVPAHESMQTAQFDAMSSCPGRGQVIGVAEEDLDADRAQLLGRQALDGGLRADGHEHRCVELSVRRLQMAEAGVAVRRRPAKRAATHLKGSPLNGLRRCS